MGDVKRPKEIKVRLSVEELKFIDNSAKECRLSREAYIRMRLKGYKPKAMPSIELLNTLNELRFIGNNINQIAFKLHLTGNFDYESYQEHYDKLQQSILEIKEIMVKPEMENYGNN